MAIVVQKYGGSSVADIDKLRAVADQVAAAKRAGNDVVVVVSAMGKTTENLLALARQAAERPDQGGDARAEPPRRELDMLVSTGERVSMALLSIAMQARDLDAISFTGSQCGILTNDRHFDARIIEVRPHRIEDELSRGRIVIVAGYQGMSYRREITTLGRGGSDTTAVALAAALGADRCEIYSDVDGVYSADPRSVPEARHLPSLDYATMQEMAECGAKVLNAQAVEWAKRSRVKIVARKTGGAARETIVEDDAPADGTPRAVVVQQKLALLSAPPASVAELFAAAAASGLPLRDVVIGATGLVAVAPLINVPDFPRVRRALGAVPGLTVEEGLGSVSLVGVEVGTRAEIVGAALEAVPPSRRMLASTPLRVSCVLPESDLAGVERAWHARFVASEPPARVAV